MPLPPLPASTTPRLYIKYSNYGIGHTMVVHLPLGSSSSAASAVYEAVAADLADLLHTSDSIQGADYSAAGSNIRFPLSVDGVPGQVSTALPDNMEAVQLTVTGRSFDGRKTRLGFFTPYFPISTFGYRTSGVSGSLAPFHALLTGSALDARSISGGAVQWNNWVNLGLNDHWVKQERSNA